MKNQLNKTIELLGWVGIALVLLAFFLNMFKIVETSNALYSLLNLVGAIFIIGSSLKKKDWQPVALNVVWALIALAGLVQVFGS